MTSDEISFFPDEPHIAQLKVQYMGKIVTILNGTCKYSGEVVDIVDGKKYQLHAPQFIILIKSDIDWFLEIRSIEHIFSHSEPHCAMMHT